VKRFAICLALVWAGFWTFFGVASGMAEGMSPLGILVHGSFPGLLFLVSAVIAWRGTLVGSWLLLVEALVVAGAFPLVMRNRPLASVAFVMITMALPPAISGAILLSQTVGRKPPA